MDFRILGPVEVGDDGRLLELPPKQRALLAILLLRGGEWASADLLIEALWGGRPPETARFALRNHIAGLRRALGPGLIVSQEGGYRLAAAAEQVDLTRFERLLEESRAADGPERLKKLQQALALWRGPALADLVYEPFAGEEAPRLEELRTSALEELADAELALGGGPELVERLEALVAEHPYRERLRAQLVLALYRSGRQVEALERYRQTRATFVEELGIEPGSALRELEQAILRHDPSLEPPLREQLPPLPERRKLVTVLFADLRFPEALDPELLRETSLESLRHVRAVLEGHGAAIEQRASEELLAVFGLPRAHEDDALRAARAALELQGEGQGVEVRLALESGEVLAGVDAAGHGFVAGAVVPAARHLLDRARAGEVLLGPLALGLLGETAVVQSGAGIAARLVRLAEPIQAEAPLAGRGEELAVLHGAFARVVDERGMRIFLLLGEAGIGKTRLAAELAGELEGRARVARGRCLSYGQSLSYWPVVEVLRSLGEPAREALERVLAGGATSPQQLAWSIRQVLAAAAAGQPLVVLLEDLHWAEPALLELLERMAALPGEAPVLLLCLARTELLERQPDWAEKESLRLEPLPRPDAEMLLQALADPPGPNERERVLVRGAGNPLFLEELSAFLAEGGGERELPPRIQAVLQARLDLLPEPERLLLACAALEGTVFHRGALAMLVPEELRPELSNRLAVLTRTLLIRPARPELEGEAGFRFRHQLIRDTAYAALPKSNRARLHERLADWLEGHRGERAELEELAAYHLEQAALTRRELETADPTLESRAARALSASAWRAWRRPDFHAAVDLWRRALALLGEDDALRPELQLELAWVIMAIGAFDEARQLLELAERTGDPATAAAVRVARLHAAFYHDPEGVTGTLRRECRHAIPLFEERGNHRWLARAWAALGEAEVLELRVEANSRAFETAAAHLELAGSRSAAMQWLAFRIFVRSFTRISHTAAVEEGKQLMERFPGEPYLEHCLGLMRSYAALDGGRFVEGRMLADESLAGFRQVGQPVIAAAQNVFLGNFELLGGHLVEAERLALTAIRELEQLGERSYLGIGQVLLADVRIAQGRYHEALELLLCVSGHFARILAAASRTRAQLGVGDLGEAEAAAEEAVNFAEATDSLDHQAEARCALAEVLTAAGRFPEALVAAEEAARLWRSLDRGLRGAYAAGLISKIKRALSASGVPAASL